MRAGARFVHRDESESDPHLVLNSKRSEKDAERREAECRLPERQCAAGGQTTGRDVDRERHHEHRFMPRDAHLEGGRERAILAGYGNATDCRIGKLHRVEYRGAQHIVQRARLGIVCDILRKIGALFGAQPAAVGVITEDPVVGCEPLQAPLAAQLVPLFEDHVRVAD
jgi:hypothetical protein